MGTLRPDADAASRSAAGSTAAAALANLAVTSTEFRVTTESVARRLRATSPLIHCHGLQGADGGGAPGLSRRL